MRPRLVLIAAMLTLVSTSVSAQANNASAKKYSIRFIRTLNAAGTILAGDIMGGPIIEVDSGGNHPAARVPVRVAVDTGGGKLWLMKNGKWGAPLDSTGTDGILTLDSLLYTGRPGHKLLTITAGDTTAQVPVTVVVGSPAFVQIVNEPSSHFLANAALPDQPSVRVTDGAENLLSGVQIAATLCFVPGLAPHSSKKQEAKADTQKQETNPDTQKQVAKPDTQAAAQTNPGSASPKQPPACVQDDTARAALEGTTVLRSDSVGEVHFTNLTVVGPGGGYRLVLHTIGRSTVGDTSGVMYYDEEGESDRSYVVVSAVKSVAGQVPKNEFFNLRFRFRFDRNVFTFAGIDVALTATDTTASAKLLTEADASIDVKVHTLSRGLAEQLERSFFVGGQVKIFNTLPYMGLQFGSTENAGSAFVGSTFYLSLLHDMTVTPNVVEGDTLRAAQWNLYGDFFIRSSTVPFFSALNVRGGVMLPLTGRNRRLISRIAIAVPVGTINLF